MSSLRFSSEGTLKETPTISGKRVQEIGFRIPPFEVEWAAGRCNAHLYPNFWSRVVELFSSYYPSWMAFLKIGPKRRMQTHCYDVVFSGCPSTMSNLHGSLPPPDVPPNTPTTAPPRAPIPAGANMGHEGWGLNTERVYPAGVSAHLPNFHDPYLNNISENWAICTVTP